MNDPSRHLREITRLAALVSLLLAGCAATGGDPRAGVPDSRGLEANVRASLSVLAADSMEGRRVGSAGAARAARFLAAELESYGIHPAYRPSAGPDSAFFQRVPLARRGGSGGSTAPRLLGSWEEHQALPPADRVPDTNVVGVLHGADPELSREAIVVGAHFDHLGVGAAVAGDSIYNGADDDASGVVAVLEIARALAAGPPPRRSIVFLLSTGEESGLLGTRWYIRNPRVHLERTVANLQIEMIGRPDPLVGGAGRAWLTGFERSSVGPMLAAAGIQVAPDPRPEQDFFLRSDNIAFACLGIPAHTLSSFGMHDDYHAPSDEIARIDPRHMTAVIETATAAVRLLADAPAPRWSEGGSPVGSASVCRR